MKLYKFKISNNLNIFNDSTNSYKIIINWWPISKKIYYNYSICKIYTLYYISWKLQNNIYFPFLYKKMFNYDLNYMQSLSWNQYIGCRNILSTFLKFSTLCARSLCNPTHFLGKSNYEKRKKI